MARPRAFDEATVVHAAQQQFWTFGYAATSLDDLVKATGLTKGSLYNAFSSKHQLYLRAFESYCSEVVERVDARLAGPDDSAAKRLRALLDGAAQTAAGSAVPRACFLAKASAELAALDEEVKARARRAFDRLETILVHSVTAAQRAGDIAAARDPQRIARHILVTLRGLEALAAAGAEREVLADAVTSLTECVFTA